MRIANAGLVAELDTAGAELVLLQDGRGRDYLWDAGPAWPRHSPVLFPIVGKLTGNAYRHAGRSYPMPQHGFARDRDFALLQHSAAGCGFRLEDDAATRTAYPFRFGLEVHYAVAGASLRVDYLLHNPGEVVLPASLGAHPGFRWPLPGAAGRPHAILFDQPEPWPVRRLAGGLLRQAPEPNPILGRRLDLSDALFVADAMILDRVASRGLDYGPTDGPRLRVDFEGFAVLGLWSKPGAGFLCIEPWCGFHSPEGWDGEIAAKPGMLSVPPGGSVRVSWTVTLPAD